jgi:phosphatidylserine/phosphatidylglycerophosphate/cardiolipin synthase-like enzyme
VFYLELKTAVMPFRVFFDGPGNYTGKNKYYSCGSSPGLLAALLQYLDDNKESLAEINIALYLFNNSFINDKLIVLAAGGVQVNVYTIPIEGYDENNPQTIIDFDTGNRFAQSSKYGLARNIFQHHYYKRHINYNLFFFPHMFLRSPHVKKFARGNMPYSLHAKSFLFKHKDGRCDVAISSSNFAVRDLVKEENLLFICNEPEYAVAAIHFFQSLHLNAIHIADYDFEKDYSDYSIETTNAGLKDCGGFIAPFYKDASLFAEDYLKQLVQNAKERIIIVGQHVCPVDYELNKEYRSNLQNKKRTGLVNDLIEKSKQGVAVSILSQTFAGGNRHETASSFRRPANQKGFIAFFELLQNGNNIQYYVNENCHSKYIIIDEMVFISTFNYTPTQFIYLDAVHIEAFTHNPDKRYRGIYAETGQYVVISDKEIVKSYRANFEKLRQDSLSKKVM